MLPRCVWLHAGGRGGRTNNEPVMLGLRSDLRCRAHEIHPIELGAGLPIRGDDEDRAGQRQKG